MSGTYEARTAGARVASTALAVVVAAAAAAATAVSPAPTLAGDAGTLGAAPGDAGIAGVVAPAGDVIGLVMPEPEPAIGPEASPDFGSTWPSAAKSGKGQTTKAKVTKQAKWDQARAGQSEKHTPAQLRHAHTAKVGRIHWSATLLPTVAPTFASRSVAACAVLRGFNTSCSIAACTLVDKSPCGCHVVVKQRWGAGCVGCVS